MWTKSHATALAGYWTTSDILETNVPHSRDIRVQEFAPTQGTGTKAYHRTPGRYRMSQRVLFVYATESAAETAARGKVGGAVADLEYEEGAATTNLLNCSVVAADVQRNGRIVVVTYQISWEGLS